MKYLVLVIITAIVFFGWQASTPSKEYWQNVGPYWDEQYNPDKYK